VAKEHLKPFKKGQSGNPKGRPPGTKNVSTLLKQMLDTLAPGEIVSTKFVREFCKGKKLVTVADATAARILNEALVKGEPWAIRELLDRTEGKAIASIELSGPDGGPVEHRVIEPGE
jgi:hypothetical protein